MIRCSFCYTDPITPIFYILIKISVSLRNFINFSIPSQYHFHIALNIIFFFAVHRLRAFWKHCLIVNLWLPHVKFLHVGCWSGFDIRFPWLSFFGLTQGLSVLISHCLQLLSAFSTAQCEFFEVDFNLVLFIYFLGHLEFLALLMVRY